MSFYIFSGEGEGELYALEFELLLGDLGILNIDGLSCVVKGRSLKNDDGHSGYTSHEEEPEEEAIQYHCDKFPILNHLFLHVIDYD